MKTTILISIIVLILFSCCGKFDVSKSDPLHLEKREYTGNQLRIDGYYYQHFNNKFFDITFFYKNGVIVVPAGRGRNSMEEMDNYVMKSFIKKNDYKKVMYWWGAFNIDEDNIAFEKWYPSEAPYKAYINEGKILNDTTFRIIKRYRLVDGVQTEVKEMNDKYHFRPFSPKPDSTNNFMDDFFKSARGDLQHFDIVQ